MKTSAAKESGVPDGRDLAISWGWHALTRNEMAAACRAKVAARPTVKFAGLAAGHTYLWGFDRDGHGSSWRSQSILKVLRVLPAGTQVEAEIDGRPPTKTHKSKWYGDFIELDSDLIAILGVTHEKVVTRAVERAVPVPVKVRCELPSLFVDIPERFQNRNVADTLHREYGEKRTNAKRIADWIEEAHRRIEDLTEAATRSATRAETRERQSDFDRYIADYRADVDYYRWLEPLVSPGGMFYEVTP